MRVKVRVRLASKRGSYFNEKHNGMGETTAIAAGLIHAFVDHTPPSYHQNFSPPAERGPDGEESSHDCLIIY